MYTLYMHTFPNNKKYIGVTKTRLQKRFGKNGNRYTSKQMKNAIDKYGWQNVEHTIIKDNLSYNEAVELEHLYILKYKANDIAFGYNKNKGGAFSENKKSYTHTLTPKRIAWYEQLKNRRRSDIERDNCKKGHLKLLNRFVCQYDLNGELKNKWESNCEIERVLGFDKSLIGRTCKHNENHSKFRTAYGFIWKYEKKD